MNTRFTACDHYKDLPQLAQAAESFLARNWLEQSNTDYDCFLRFVGGAYDQYASIQIPINGKPALTVHALTSVKHRRERVDLYVSGWPASEPPFPWPLIRLCRVENFDLTDRLTFQFACASIDRVAIPAAHELIKAFKRTTEHFSFLLDEVSPWMLTQWERERIAADAPTDSPISIDKMINRIWNVLAPSYLKSPHRLVERAYAVTAVYAKRCLPGDTLHA